MSKRLHIYNFVSLIFMKAGFHMRRYDCCDRFRLFDFNMYSF